MLKKAENELTLEDFQLKLVGPQPSPVRDCGNIFQLQILSDLHIEMGHQGNFEFEAVAPYLALLGDIGQPKRSNYAAFLRTQADRFKKVFVVAGNHEFFGTTYEESRQEIENICSTHPNLLFLDRKSETVDGVRIIGATLWSSIPPHAANAVETKWNDYTQISIKENGKKRNITHKETNIWFKNDLQFIKDELEEAKKEKQLAIVLTHHKPIGDYPGASTNLVNIMNPPMIAWCHGHTHSSNNGMHNDVRIASNQLGYEYCMGEVDSSFHTEFILVVDEKGKTWTLGGDSRATKLWQKKAKTETEVVNKPTPAPPPPPPGRK